MSATKFSTSKKGYQPMLESQSFEEFEMTGDDSLGMNNTRKERSLIYRFIGLIVYLFAGLMAFTITIGILSLLFSSYDANMVESGDGADSINAVARTILAHPALMVAFNCFSNVVMEIGLIASCLFVVHGLPWNPKSTTMIGGVLLSAIGSAGLYTLALSYIYSVSKVKKL